MLGLLQTQGLSLQSIPKAGRKIRLNYLANMSLGAIATDVIEEIDPVFRSWVERLSRETGMDLFALDVITANHACYEVDNAWALEINSLPGWLHHTFSERRQHDISSMILIKLFF